MTSSRWELSQSLWWWCSSWLPLCIAGFRKKRDTFLKKSDSWTEIRWKSTMFLYIRLPTTSEKIYLYTPVFQVEIKYWVATLILTVLKVITYVCNFIINLCDFFFINYNQIEWIMLLIHYTFNWVVINKLWSLLAVIHFIQAHPSQESFNWDRHVVCMVLSAGL